MKLKEKSSPNAKLGKYRTLVVSSPAKEAEKCSFEVSRNPSGVCHEDPSANMEVGSVALN